MAFGKHSGFILKKLIPMLALVWLSERIFQQNSWKNSSPRVTSYRMNSASRRPFLTDCWKQGDHTSERGTLHLSGFPRQQRLLFLSENHLWRASGRRFI